MSAPGGGAFDAIVQRFGTADREKIRARVFSDSAARKDLEKILHPLIQSESQRWVASYAGPVIYEAALLVETGRARDFDGLIVVEAPFEIRKQRIMKRNCWSAEMAENVLRSQLDDASRREAATWVIQNTGSLQDLEAAVIELVPRLV